LAVAPPVAESTIAIDAPIDVVWSVMTDVARYREWNPFIIAVELRDGGALAVGSALTLHVRAPGERWGVSTIEVVTRLEAPPPATDGPRRAAMEYLFTGWLDRLALVRGSRLQALDQAPGMPTIYRTTEQFRGLLARAVPLARVQRGFDAHAAALKQRAEAHALTGSAP